MPPCNCCASSGPVREDTRHQVLDRLLVVLARDHVRVRARRGLQLDVVLEVDDRAVSLKNVHLFDARDVAHAELLQRRADALVVTLRRLVDRLLLAAHRALAAGLGDVLAAEAARDHLRAGGGHVGLRSRWARRRVAAMASGGRAAAGGSGRGRRAARAADRRRPSPRARAHASATRPDHCSRAAFSSVSLDSGLHHLGRLTARRRRQIGWVVVKTVTSRHANGHGELGFWAAEAEGRGRLTLRSPMPTTWATCPASLSQKASNG